MPGANGKKAKTEGYGKRERERRQKREERDLDQREVRNLWIQIFLAETNSLSFALIVTP